MSQDKPLSERLARRVRDSLGPFNDEDKDITTLVSELVARTPAAQDAAQGREVVAWEYSMAHTNHPSGKIFETVPMLTYSSRNAFAPGTINQRPLSYATPTTNSGEIGRKSVGGEGEADPAKMVPMCGAPKDGRTCYPECGCETEAHSEWGANYEHASTDPLDVDALAQEIRRVDGNHSLGAGALAEALMPFLRRLSRSGGVS